LGVLDHLYAVNDAEAFTSPELNEAIEDGRIRALGTRYGSTIELAVAADPDIVFLFYSAAPNANVHPALVAMGVHGIPMGDHFERSELGRSEWLKFLALFFNREARANAILAPRERRYQELLQLAAGAKSTPTVMLGFPLNAETWNAVGAQNLFAQLVRDAHGRYFISNQEANSNVRISFEKALDASDDASVWIGLFGVNRVADKKALVKPNPQLASMGPLRHGHVYAMDLGMTQHRVFPFSDQSLDHPDDILADFIHAIHPELFANSKPTFLRELR
jgi:iron complex transport system substrate-binding protein